MAGTPEGLSVHTQERFGWRPDLPDIRDAMLVVAPPAALPAVVSLRSQMPPVYDQGQLGSCTANSIGAILEFNELKQKEPTAATPSRLFIYYNERLMEGTVKEDAGGEIRDGIKSVAQVGAPPETLWPYVIAQFATKPSAAAYTEARKHEAIRYSRVAQDQTSIQNVLALGFPISFGFTVYASFESDVGANGIVPMPQPQERSSAATPSSRSDTRRSGGSSTSSAATRGVRPGAITATSGCRPPTWSAARWPAISG